MIPQYEPVYGPEEREAVSKLMESGSWLTEGPKTREFEERIAAFLGVKHCFCVPSGTMGLVIALLAVGVKAGDNVMVPRLTMPATWNSVKILGAHPAIKEFLDIEIVAHLNGIGCFPQIRRDVTIEDACQAFGSKRNGHYLGTMSEIGIYSFGVHKIISTGQGGCVVTNSDRLAGKIRAIKDNDKINGFARFGINAKFTDLQAVIGIEQLKRIHERITFKRRLVKEWYGFPIIEEQVPWFAEQVFLTQQDACNFVNSLKSQGIETRYGYESFPGINQTAFSVWLPSSFNLTESTVKGIREKIIEFYTKRDTIAP